MNIRVKANKGNSTQVEGEVECSRMMQGVNPEIDPFWNSCSLNFFHRIHYSSYPGPREHNPIFQFYSFSLPTTIISVVVFLTHQLQIIFKILAAQYQDHKSDLFQLSIFLVSQEVLYL